MQIVTGNERLRTFFSGATDRAMQALIVGLTIGYAWLTASGLEPRLEIPHDLVSTLTWVEDGHSKAWTEIRSHRARELAPIGYQLSRLGREFSDVFLGWEEPPHLIIDADHPDTYRVSADRIDLSERIAGAEGQLARALVKSWLLANGAVSVTDSLLRADVVADGLVLLRSNEAGFGVPGSHRIAEVPEARDWLPFARSFADLCGSPWLSLELRGHCGESLAMSPLAFRPLLDSIVMDVLRSVSPLDRTQIARSWIAALRANRETPSAPVARRSLTEWRAWLEGELDQVFPIKDFSGLKPEMIAELQASLARAKTKAQLVPGGTLLVEYAFHRSGESVALKGDAVREHSFVLGSDRGVDLFPGGARLRSDEMRELHAGLLVWEACEPVTLSEILDHPIHADRILYIQSCDESSTAQGWEAILRGGLREFAHHYPDTPFLQLRATQIDLALKKGDLKRDAWLTRYMVKRPDRSLLGLNSAEWRRDYGAYHVLGAIEAIEWFRTPRSL